MTDRELVLSALSLQGRAQGTSGLKHPRGKALCVCVNRAEGKVGVLINAIENTRRYLDATAKINGLLCRMWFSAIGESPLLAAGLNAKEGLNDASKVYPIIC